VGLFVAALGAAARGYLGIRSGGLVVTLSLIALPSAMLSLAGAAATRMRTRTAIVTAVASAGLSLLVLFAYLFWAAAHGAFD
jgi:hypothetical protein